MIKIVADALSANNLHNIIVWTYILIRPNKAADVMHLRVYVHV